MSYLFVLICFVAIGFWLYGPSPFFRVRRYLAKNRANPLQPFVPIRALLQDTSNPLRKDLITTAYAYGGFVACVLVASVIGYFIIPTHN